MHGGKRCIFVRNKIDGEFEPGFTDADLRARIAASFREQIGGEARLVFTSCRTMKGLDELQTTIMNTLSGVKRDRFLRSAAAYSKEFLDAKKAACQKYAWFAAGASAAANMAPVPGLGIAADISAVLSAMAKIRSDFNLTVARMDRFAILMPGAAPVIKTIISYATSEGAMLLLKRLGGAVAVSEAAKYFPFAGTLIAGSVSLAATLLVLKMYIDDCYKIADEMLSAHFQG